MADQEKWSELPPEDRMWTDQQQATYRGCSIHTVWRDRKLGRTPPAVKLGKRWMTRGKAVIQYYKELEA